MAGCSTSSAKQADNQPTSPAPATVETTTAQADVTHPTTSVLAPGPTTRASDEAVPDTTPPTVAPATTPATEPATTLLPASSEVTQAPSAIVTRPTERRVPLADGVRFGFGGDHSGYPATDIFADCGADVVSPVDGTILEVRTIDSWQAGVDNPATRGGKSISILGTDGVRYYMSHFSEIDADREPGQLVQAGDHLAQVGRTGRAGACHVHFGLSPACPRKEWKVRRGAIWPSKYLDAWRDGDNRSPADEIAKWVAANPEGCAEAMAETTAEDS